MVGIGRAIRYPMVREEWWKTVAIGGVLIIFSFLVIPLIAVYGYLITVISDSLEGRPVPPPFRDWGAILRKGVLGWLIGLVYLLVPIVVAAVTVGGSLAAMVTGSGMGTATGVAGLVGGLGVSVVLSLVFGYFAVVAIVNYARTDRVAAAFNVATIKRVAFDGEYFAAWVVSIVVFIAASVIAGALNIIPFLGAIVGAFVFFYAEVVAAHLWADGFTAAIHDGDRRSVGVEDPAV